MNSLGILQALAFEPKKAFAELDARPRVLFPLALLIVGSVAILFWYFSVVDTEWFVENTLRTSGRGAQMSDEQLRAARVMSGGLIKWISLVGAPISVLLTRVLEAVYYLLAGKITNVQRGFKQWLALASWSSLPSVLGVIPSAIVLLTAKTAQIEQGELQPLSLNSLIFHRSAGEPGYTLLIAINLLQLLGMALATMGVRQWSRRSWLFSVVFTFLPVVLIYGIWGWFALGRS